MFITPPHCPENAPARWTDGDLPSYRFIPGLNPHPVRDPLGHSYGKEPTAVSYLSAENWQENRSYLSGVDLYNQAYWWEAHEAWETVWHTTDKQGAYGQFLQGLIQISAAFIKWHLRQHEGLKVLYDIGRGRLQYVQKQNPIFMGLDLDTHLQKLQAHFQSVQSEPDTWPDALRNYPFLVLEKDL